MTTLEQHVIRRVWLLSVTVRSLLADGLDAKVRMQELSKLVALLDTYHRSVDVNTASLELFVNAQLDVWDTLRDVEEWRMMCGERYNQQAIDDMTDNIEFLLDVLAEFTVEQSKQG